MLVGKKGASLGVKVGSEGLPIDSSVNPGFLVGFAGGGMGR